MIASSLPSRERGLKYCMVADNKGFSLVAPFTGAWIEIELTDFKQKVQTVAPFTGAWIEILQKSY